MSYYRLRDIKTPPFAYVVNKEEALQSCNMCLMPFRDFVKTLKVEICAADTEDWAARILGRPMMADHWLIGDERFCDALHKLLPHQFDLTPIAVSAWFTRTSHSATADPSELLKKNQHASPPRYFYLKPKRVLNLDAKLLESFPPIQCSECGREIPEIPIDFQPLPNLEEHSPQIASLKGLYLEGYDYLFHETTVPALDEYFPEMILERLRVEPSCI